jgi:regulator of protease activity HflC (stomatin/prohibitin superfamily)
MFRRLKVWEFERGILFRDGRFVRVLEPGFHWIRGEVTTVDIRRRDTLVDVGPVLTRDLVPIGVRLKVSYRVRDAKVALLQSFEYRAQLVNDATASVHRTLSRVAMEELSAEHHRLEESIQDRLALEVASYGLRVEDVSIIQVRFPRALRRKLKRMEVGGLP